MSTIHFKPGDTFAYVGQLSDDTNPSWNLTGWTIDADIRALDPSGVPASGTPLAEPTVTVTDPVNRVFELRVGDTSAWPVRARLAMDVRLTAPDSTRTRLPTITIETSPGVTV